MRREPTLGGIKHEAEDNQAAKHSTARPDVNSAPRRTATASARPAPVASSPFPVLALFALLVACGTGGAAYWLYGELIKTQQQLLVADNRLVALESSLKLTGNESAQSVASINESLKLHFSEIDKLWAAYRTHKEGIAESSKLAKSAAKNSSDALAKAKPLSSSLAVVSDLVDAQQTALSQIEKTNATVSAQARAVNEKAAKLEQSMAALQQQMSNVEKDIEAINGFRRTVNQEILQLKGGAQ